MSRDYLTARDDRGRKQPSPYDKRSADGRRAERRDDSRKRSRSPVDRSKDRHTESDRKRDTERPDSGTDLLLYTEFIQ